MRWTIEQIAQMTGGSVSGNPAVVVRGVSTDTRDLKRDELFVPLRGPNFDGHEFLGHAVRSGAAACLSEDPVAGSETPVVLVEDTLKAFGDMAAAVRAEFDGPVVGVTGTSGKTTTKEMIAAILTRTGPGVKTAGNYNNLIGLPKTLFGLRQEHQWLVLEMGMNRRGEIARLSQIAAPTVGLITNVGEGHLEGLGGIEGVARAKGELFAAIRSGGIAVVNCDDARVMQLPVANGVRRLTFGFGLESLDVSGELLEATANGSRLGLSTPQGRVTVALQAPGRHQAANALAAAAVAVALQVPLEKIVQGLESFRPSGGRMEPLALRDDILLLDDSYNANPLSMRSALETLKGLQAGDGRYALLGDMLELGEDAAALHREIGRFAADCVDALVAMGEHAADIAEGAVSAGLAREKALVVEDHVGAIEALQVWLQHGSRILVKGSRGMRMEQACRLLQERYGNGEGR